MGRPREFDPEQAIEAVKATFWRLGYEGTSMQDIEAATGLKKQSLYRLLGDKRRMYLRALAHYEEHELRDTARGLREEGTARERFARLFHGAVDEALGRGDRRGCFLCNAGIDQAQLDAETRASVGRTLEGVRGLFMEALAVSPPYRRDARRREVKAAQLMALYFGLRALIRADVPEAVLRDAADAAIASIEG